MLAVSQLQSQAGDSTVTLCVLGPVLPGSDGSGGSGSGHGSGPCAGCGDSGDSGGSGDAGGAAQAGGSGDNGGTAGTDLMCAAQPHRPALHDHSCQWQWMCAETSAW